MPLPIKAVMAASVAVLSIAILLVAGGAVGPAVAGAVHGIGGLVTTVGKAVASPSPTGAPPVRYSSNQATTSARACVGGPTYRRFGPARSR